MKYISNTVKLEETYVIAPYTHAHCKINQATIGQKTIEVIEDKYQFKTDLKVPKVGLMMIGLGGNNGTTIVGGILANKHKITWNDKKGLHHSNFLGSVCLSSSMKIASCGNQQIFEKFTNLLPLLDPTQLVVSGWDISNKNLGEAMKRAQVFDYDLQKHLYPLMEKIEPLPSIYYQDFIALNQRGRADNIIKSSGKYEDLQIIRKNIREFKQVNELDKVIVLWTANTQRFCKQTQGVHDTVENLENAIKQNHRQISASTIFAYASLLQNASFINGSPQNTLVPAILNMQTKGFMVGSDFKTGQTKFKTNFIDFLLQAGIKPRSCISYNHLGNNDGKNLSSESQFKSKEISKASCVNDLLEHSLLYKQNQTIDHSVVIKYLPTAGDSKKAIDQYCSDIFMDGNHTLVAYNVCEDSLLAAGVIFDLIILTQLFTRLTYRKEGGATFNHFPSVLSFLGYLMKAPEVVGPQVNSLTRQRLCIQNLFRICIGLPIEDNLLLNFRLK